MYKELISKTRRKKDSIYESVRRAGEEHQKFLIENTGLTNNGKYDLYLLNPDGVLSNNRHFIADTQAEYQPNGDATSEGQAIHILGNAYMYIATKEQQYLDSAIHAWEAYVRWFYAGQPIPESPRRWICNWILNGKEPVLANFPINPVHPTLGGYKCVPIRFTNGMGKIPHGEPFYGEWLDVVTFAHRGVPGWEAINAGMRPIQEQINWDELETHRVTSMPDTPWDSRAFVHWDRVANLTALGPTADWNGPYIEEYDVSWINVWTGNKIGIGPGPDDQLWSGDIIETNIPQEDIGLIQLANKNINGVYFVNYATRPPVSLGGYMFKRNEVWHNRPIHTPLLGSYRQMGNAADAEVWFIDCCYLLWRITGDSRFKKALDSSFYTADEYTYIDTRDKFFRRSTVATTPHTDGISYDFTFPAELKVDYGRDSQGYIKVNTDEAGSVYLENQSIWFRINASDVETVVSPHSKVVIEYGGTGVSGKPVSVKAYLDLQNEKGEVDHADWFVLSLPDSIDATIKRRVIPIKSFIREDDYHIIADPRLVVDWGDLEYALVIQDRVFDSRSALVCESHWVGDSGGLVIGFWLTPDTVATPDRFTYKSNRELELRFSSKDGYRYSVTLPNTNNNWISANFDIYAASPTSWQPIHRDTPLNDIPPFTDSSLEQVEIQLKDTSEWEGASFSWYAVNEVPEPFQFDDGWTNTFRIQLTCEEPMRGLLGDCTVVNPRLDSLAYAPGVIPFSNIYEEGTPAIGYWHGMPYPGYQYPVMYAITNYDELDRIKLLNQINFLRDGQKQYYHQTGILGPGSAAYIWDRMDNYKYGGVIPTPAFLSTYGGGKNAATALRVQIKYKAAQPFTIHLYDEGGARWDVDLPASPHWFHIENFPIPRHVSGNPRGNLDWSGEPLWITTRSEVELFLPNGRMITLPNVSVDFHLNVHWGDGKPWAGYQPRAFNAAARCWYEMRIRGMEIPQVLEDYCNTWVDWIIKFVDDNGTTPSEFPMVPAGPVFDPNDYTAHMTGLFLSGLSHCLMAGNKERKLKKTILTVQKDLLANQYFGDTPKYSRLVGGWAAHAERNLSFDPAYENGMVFGFYTGEIYRGLAASIMALRYGEGYDMYATLAIPNHDTAKVTKAPPGSEGDVYG